MNMFSKNKDIHTIVTINNKNKWKRIATFVLGCYLIAIAYNVFIAPNKLVPGGVGGIAVLVNNLTHIDNSFIILIVNIILLLFSYFFLGKEKTKSNILGTLLFPLLVKVTQYANVWIQMDTSKVLLSAIVGGILHGIGLGLVFKAGFTTGGTDILNQIISKYGKMSLGKSMLYSDGLIVVLSGIIFGIYNMMYSILVLYIISLISDRIVLGISDNKMFYIISEKDEEIKSYIINNMKHGVTTFQAKGGMRKNKENIIMTVLPTKDFYELKTNIKRIDEEAFFIITDSYEVFGGE